ncbi:MAG: nuclease [Methyloceanibacter sp.]|nr:MAG: nuclease [Methyloceanibacter sp.]
MIRAALLLAVLAPTMADAATLTGKAEIVDGDTIKVGGLAVRLQGIDAPERAQMCERGGKTYPCGKEATKALAALIGGKDVACEVVGKDSYGRVLGLCSANGTDLNETMVHDGWALAFVKYSNLYTAQQRSAEAAEAGLWAGTFIKPWDWRHGELETATKTEGCVIKGNINRSGDHIYHMPFHQHYGRTKIDESKGERWFCTEDEALSAGWRRALQ